MQQACTVVLTLLSITGLADETWGRAPGRATRSGIPSSVVDSTRDTTGARTPDFDTGAIDQAVATYMRNSEIPGVVLGVVVGESLVYSKAYGVADASSDRPLATDAVFRIASLTKLFTASLMVALEQDGVLRADDPVDDYLENVQAPRDAHGRAIRLMDLATHLSGLPREPPNRRDRPASPTVMEPYSVPELYAALRKTSLLGAPGGRAAYSSFGYGLLGHALERSVGAELEDVMRARLWARLGMESTYVLNAPEGAPALAAPHWDWFSPRRPSRPQDYGSIWGMNGISSNLPDLARFVSYQFRAHSPAADVIDGERLAAMHQPHAMRSTNWDADSGAYGIGWIVKIVEDVGALIEHDGNNDGHSAYIAALPEDGIGWIVLANVGGVADEIGEAIQPHVLKPLISQKSALHDAVEEGDWARVLDVTAELLMWNPHNRRAHYWHGRALAEVDRCAEALPDLDAAHEAGMYREYVAFYRAVCLAQAGELDDAGNALEQAFQLGFTDGERLKRYPALESLSDHPAYRILHERYAH